MKTWVTKSGYSIHRILGGRGNAYAVANGEHLLLIDTGRKFRWRALRRGIDALRSQGAPAALILTHTHFDHAENAARLKQAYGARIIAHASEQAYLRAGDSPLPRGSIPPTRWLIQYLGRLAQPIFRYAGVAADIAVDARYDLRSFGAYLLHTPGHTRGSLSLIVDDEIAVVGDTLFGVIPGRVFPPFADDVPELLRSWERLLETPCRLFLPGHGGAIKRTLLEKAWGARTGLRTLP